MDIRRCDQCGIESPAAVRHYLPREQQWWDFGQEYRNRISFCSWACVVKFISRHSNTAPISEIDAKEVQYRWNPERQEYQHILPVSASPSNPKPGGRVRTLHRGK